VICITCGRDNPAHLTFCQECGQKLGVRSLAPAPMVNLSGPSNGPSAGASGAGIEAKPSQPPRPPSLVPQRPPAPEVNFAGMPERADDLESRGAGDGGDRAGLDPPCPLCGHRNPRSLRFCVTCGHLLAPPSMPPPLPFAATALPSNRPPPVVVADRRLPLAGGMDPTVPVPTPPPPPLQGELEAVPKTIRPPAPEPLSATAQSPIAPARVVDLGTPASDAMLRLCPRCRGGSDPSSHFCRFCGASLADAPAIALAPRTPPPPAPTAASGAEAPGAVVPSTPLPPPMRPSPTPVRSTVSMVSPIGGANARARLVLIARDGGEGPGFPLGEASDIGRTEGNILLGDDRYVSPRHARIQVRGASYYLRDLASTNGVFMRIPFARERDVGGPSRRPDGGSPGGPHQALEQPIQDQDLFLVGQQVLKFEVVKHAEEGFGAASENGTLVFGTPAAPRYARLCQRTVEGVVRDVYYLQKAETIIGREVGDLVFTEDPFLSRRHAAIVVQGVAHGSKGQRRFSLMDLGSSNGTFLQLREEIRLKNGDHLRIGQQLFRFDLDRTDA
jgi:pSer/pThr/pTyr-binding forkhead associated (FHA) protein